MNPFQALTLASTDITKAWFNFPAPHVGALLEGPRKNVVALSKANQVLFDGLKTLAQRERDLFTLDHYAKVSSDVLSGTSVQEMATKQIDVAGQFYVSSFARCLELSGILVKTNASAMDILNTRVTEVFDEFRALFTGRGAAINSATAASVTAEPNAFLEETLPVTNAAIAIPGISAEATKTAGTARAASKRSSRTSKGAPKTPARTASARRRTSRGK